MDIQSKLPTAFFLYSDPTPCPKSPRLRAYPVSGRHWSVRHVQCCTSYAILCEGYSVHTSCSSGQSINFHKVADSPMTSMRKHKRNFGYEVIILAW